MTVNPTNDIDTRRLLRLLDQIAKLAERSSLTGAFSEDGAVDAVAKYNLIVARLSQKGFDLGDLFPELPADASMERVGVAAQLLSSFMEEDEDNGPPPTPNIVIGNLGSVGDLEKLKDLGKVIEEHFPDWMRKKSEPVVARTTDNSETDTVKAEVIPMPDLSRTSA